MLTFSSDAMAANYGVLVSSWPIGLGADASGVVVEVGQEAKDKYGFQGGEYVCGCTRIGHRDYSTSREYFLMDAQVAMRKPSNLSLAEASTVGAAFQTASFGLFAGLKVPLPGFEDSTSAKDTWILVLGGAGSVGRAGVQLAHASGCKVIASCSEKSFDSVKKIGADAVFDYHLSVDDQLAAVDRATSGATINKIFDATSADDPVLAKALFHQDTKGDPKLFATTNDWSNIGDFEGGGTYEIHLGLLGRPDAKEINSEVEQYNPVITSLFEAGKIHPQEHEEIGSGGLEDAIKAYKHKAGSRKVVVKIQDE